MPHSWAQTRHHPLAGQYAVAVGDMHQAGDAANQQIFLWVERAIGIPNNIATVSTT